MLETLALLDVARRMQSQFEMDDTVASRARRSREHRPRVRAASIPKTRVFARLRPSRAPSGRTEPANERGTMVNIEVGELRKS